MHISEGIITGYPAAAYTAGGAGSHGLGDVAHEKVRRQIPG